MEMKLIVDTSDVESKGLHVLQIIEEDLNTEKKAIKNLNITIAEKELSDEEKKLRAESTI